MRPLVLLLATTCATIVAASAGGANQMFANTQLQSVMSGPAVVGGGDPDGRARMQVTVRSNAETRFVRVCFRTIAKSKLDEASMTYLRKGAAGTNGPTVFALDTGQAAGCTARRMRKALFDDFTRRVVEAPHTLYVQLSTTGYPNGAVRGQLAALVR